MAQPKSPALISACVGGQTPFASAVAKVAGTVNVAIEHDPAVPAGQAVLVALGAKVARALVSASVDWRTADVPMAARREASATTPAPEAVSQFMVTIVVPATTPTINVWPGTAVPAPVTETLQGAGGATCGAIDAAVATPTETSVKPTIIAMADAPARTVVIDARRVERTWELLNGFLMESP
jgi:hypothetical protein